MDHTMSELPPFQGFPKIARYNREVVLTEKIDGTNGCVHVADDGTVSAGSRSRWITPESDNYGFAKWVKDNEDELRNLGPGLHFGEWWGQGIQRKYGLTEKRFSLFNVSKWADDAVRPKCCYVVPELWRGPAHMLQFAIELTLGNLRRLGSVAAPCFMSPEGIVVFHTAGSHLYKITLEDDATPKSAASK
jgi:hypothetical protein